jgi:hypothetical protein
MQMIQLHRKINTQAAGLLPGSDFISASLRKNGVHMYSQMQATFSALQERKLQVNLIQNHLPVVSVVTAAAAWLGSSPITRHLISK